MSSEYLHYLLLTVAWLGVAVAFIGLWLLALWFWVDASERRWFWSGWALFIPAIFTVPYLLAVYR